MEVVMKKLFLRSVLVLAVAVGASLTVLADTIHLKDGSVIRGQIIGFRNEQFTILVGSGARGRKSQITVYMEDVDWIEFDSAGNAGDDTSSGTTQTSQPPYQSTTNTQPTNTQPTNTQPSYTPPSTTTPANSGAPPTFFQIKVRVRADNVSNGWTNSGLVVRRGQRLRITASGRVNLGNNRVSPPDGLPNIPDRDKLMRNQPTGALIAVIGDDNDDFIFIGSSKDFVAQRDGVLFLGVNEGNLSDNSGNFDVVIEAEAVSGMPR
jgi:PA-IL-like protein